MQKIVVNKCYGGFGLSKEAAEIIGLEWREDGSFSYPVGERDIARNDPKLIEAVEKLGKGASREFGNLQIVEIPDDVEWQIEEYDGNEWVSEKASYLVIRRVIL